MATKAAEDKGNAHHASQPSGFALHPNVRVRDVDRSQERFEEVVGEIAMGRSLLER